MHFWDRFPFVRLLTAFISGIIISDFLNPEIQLSFLWSTLIVFILLSSGLFIFSRNHQRWRKYRVFSGIFLLGILFLIAFQWNTFQKQKHDPSHLQHYDSIPKSKIKIIKQEKITGNYIRYQAEVCQIKIDGHWKKVKGKIILYQYSPTDTFELHQKILLSSFLLKFPPAMRMSYQKYLLRKGITHISYFSSDKSILQEKEIPFLDIESVADRARNYVQTTFASHIQDTLIADMACTLVLGGRSDLPEEVMNAYSVTGTLHVLAVSGMHVAIVYLMIAKLLSVFQNVRFGKYIIPVLGIICLWAYAFLSGFSASVLRAALMFSCMLIADGIRRENISINSLCIAAFILLCFQPSMIYDAGFLLSFSAVAGIMIFYPLLKKYFEMENIIGKNIRDMLLLSVSAQLGTLPIQLYLFHQFPCYFLISNLFIIPLAVIGLYLGIFLLVISFIPVVSSYVALSLEYCIVYMNDIAAWIASWNGSSLTLLPFDLVDATLLIIIIGSLALFLQSKKFSAWFIMAVSFMFLQWHLAWLSQNNSLQVSYFRKQKVYAYTRNDQTWLLLPSGIPSSQMHSDLIQNGAVRIKVCYYPE